jgi:hypothetical protein
VADVNSDGIPDIAGNGYGGPAVVVLGDGQVYLCIGIGIS